MPKSKLAELNALRTGVVSRIKKAMLIKTDMERSFFSMLKDRKMSFLFCEKWFPSRSEVLPAEKPINIIFNVSPHPHLVVCGCLLQDLERLAEEEQ
jgi:hypothetical protein